MLAKAGGSDPEKLIKAAEGLEAQSPFGKYVFRASDHQSTLGAFVGTTAVKDGKGVMTDFAYKDGAAYLPSDGEVKTLRPQS
jgi:branched-chain amino acid transport system substrate-binding protein